MKASPFQKERGARAILISLVLFGFPIAEANAQPQDDGAKAVHHPWVNEPSPSLAAKLGHWRLHFMLGDLTDAPGKGIFPSFSPDRMQGAAHLISTVTASPSAKPLELTPVNRRTRYVPATDPRNDPDDRVITTEIVEILASAEILQFLAAKQVVDPRLNVKKNIAVALVQDFDAALRTPNKKEHVWSINWRVETEYGDPDYVGYEAWGLFTRENGILKPFYLAANKSSVEAPSAVYYYFVAVGDLDGDGIDEFVTRQKVFEGEEDNLEIMAWESSAPVWMHGIP